MIISEMSINTTNIDIYNGLLYAKDNIVAFKNILTNFIFD